MISEARRKKRNILRGFIALCLLCVATALAGGYLLKKGFSIEQLSLGGLNVSHAHLIWNTKLELEIGHISIDKKENSPPTEQLRNDISRHIGRGIKSGYYFFKIFSKLHIKTLQLGPTSLEIGLIPKEGSSHNFFIRSNDFSLDSTIIFENEKIHINIADASSTSFNSVLTGTMQLDGNDRKLTGDISALINKRFPLSLQFTADNESLTFSGTEAGEITEIKSLVDLFRLRHSIQRWITDYLKGSRYHSLSFKGVIPWSNPIEILNTLEAEVIVDDTEYTFAPGLEPIKATSTNVSFKDGVLDILPHEATFYGQNTGDSWLDINFNDPDNILLTAYIKTTAVANDDILTLLDYYKIPFPFKQVDGETVTDLTLSIILNNQHLQAQGRFEIAQGAIEWGGKKFSVNDALFQLATTDVTIDRLQVSYENLVTAEISGHVLTKKKIGNLDINLQMLNFQVGDSHLTIDKSKPLKGSYHFAPAGHFLKTEASSWLLDTLPLDIGPLSSPFDYTNWGLKVDKVKLSIPNTFESEVTGDFLFKNQKADFTCDVLKFSFKDFKLASPHLVFDISWNGSLRVANKEAAEWKMSNIPITFYPSIFEFEEDTLSVLSSRLSYGDFFESHFAGYFNITSKSGRFSLKEIDVTREKLEKMLTLGENIDIDIHNKDGNYAIFFPLFDLHISSDKQKNWSAQFGDIAAIYPHSKLLQKYNIKEGTFTFSSVNGKRPYSFNGEIKTPWPLMMEEQSPIDVLFINGKLTDQGVLTTINENLDLSFMNNKLRINSDKLGYNLPGVLKMIDELVLPEDQDKSTQTKRPPFALHMSAENGHISLSPKSMVLSDNMKLILRNGQLGMELEHGDGILSLQLEKGSFNLNGRDLNDTFMGALIHSSKFQSGTMSIAAMGVLKEFSAVIEIDDTILRNMATVNNMMAFINTVPSLATFSLPEFSTKGFPVDSAVAGIKFKDNAVHIESLEVLSPELYAKGQGEINLSSKEIDMDIQLKTEASRNVGKIPLVGYVLTGEQKNSSLNVKITGHHNDPDVDYSIVKNIVTYPAEILYRTLKLPFHLGNKIFSDSEKPENKIPYNKEQKVDQ